MCDNVILNIIHVALTNCADKQGPKHCFRDVGNHQNSLAGKRCEKNEEEEDGVHEPTAHLNVHKNDEKT